MIRKSDDDDDDEEEKKGAKKEEKNDTKKKKKHKTEKSYDEEDKQIIAKLKSINAIVTNLDDVIRVVKKNIGANIPIIVPIRGNYPNEPASGRVALGKMPFPIPSILPIQANIIQQKSKQYGSQTEAIIQIRPYLDFAIHNSKLVLLLSNQQNYTCLRMTDLLRYMMHVWQLCSDSNDIAESARQRVKFLEECDRLKQLAEDRLNLEITNILTQANKENPISAKVGLVLLRDLATIILHYIFDEFQALDITIINFFSANNLHKDGIPLKYRADFMSRRIIPPKSHVSVDCLKHIMESNEQLIASRNSEIRRESDLKQKIPTFPYYERLKKLISDLQIGSSEVKLKVSGYRYEETRKWHFYNIVNPLRKDSILQVFFSDDEFRQLNLKQNSPVIPFAYWNYDTLVELVKWIEFTNETIDLKEYTDNILDKMSIKDNIELPPLIKLEDPYMCEIDTLMQRDKSFINVKLGGVFDKK